MVFEWRGQEYTGSITFILFSIRRFYNEYYRIHYWKYFHSSFLTNNKRRQLKSLSNMKYILPGEQIKFSLVNNTCPYRNYPYTVSPISSMIIVEFVFSL